MTSADLWMYLRLSMRAYVQQRHSSDQPVVECSRVAGTRVAFIARVSVLARGEECTQNNESRKGITELVLGCVRGGVIAL